MGRVRSSFSLARQLSLGTSRRAVVAIIFLLVAGAYVLRFADDNIADEPLLLFVLPIAIGAVAFGLNGGAALGALSLALTTAWYVQGDVELSAVGFASQATALLTVGLLVGRFADLRRSLEQQLARHEELSLDLICTANFEGFFTRVNPAWTHTLGWKPEELLSRPFLEFVHPDDREATTVEAARQIEAGEEVLRFENRYLCSDGSYRWLEWTSRPDHDAGRLIAVARDVTARKEAEETVRRYQDMLEREVKERTAALEARTLEVDQARLEILQRLALAAEYRDDDTYEHTQRVARTATLLAQAIGMSKREIALLTQAAPLHDIGKLAVSDALLLKPERLTPDEFEQIKGHAAAGAAILAGSSSAVLQLAEEIALSHHEWWNGDGYPAMLEGEAIPLVGRIVAVADVFDALTHRRPYKEAWPIHDAVAEIAGLSGRQFEPCLVDAFLALDHEQLLTPLVYTARSSLYTSEESAAA